MDTPKYKRVLIKISGEALAGDNKFGLNFDVIGPVCDVVKKCVEIGTEVGGERDVVLQTVDGMFLKFPLAEIPELKKNSRGVRGIRLEKEDTLEHVYLPDVDGTAHYKGKEVALGRLKAAKRDGKGTKVRL